MYFYLDDSSGAVFGEKTIQFIYKKVILYINQSKCTCQCENSREAGTKEMRNVC